MTKAKLTRPDLMENSQKNIKEMGQHYPMARILFLQERKVGGAVIKTWSKKELGALSKAELKIPLNKREY